MVLYFGILALVGGGTLAYPAASHWWRVQSMPPAADRTVAYEADVLPILEEHCYECHGDGRSDGRSKGGFNVEARDVLLRGGGSGPAAVAGDSARSPFVHRIAGISDERRMPPDNRTPLTPAQIGILRAWIDQGLVWEDPA